MVMVTVFMNQELWYYHGGVWRTTLSYMYHLDKIVKEAASDAPQDCHEQSAF